MPLSPSGAIDAGCQRPVSGLKKQVEASAVCPEPVSPSVKASGFWRWFESHQAEYRRLPANRDALLDAFEERLLSLADGLSFEISEEKDGLCELIIGADGRKERVAVAEAIAAQASAMSGWKVFALKPALGFDFTHQRKGHRFDPKGMWFEPLSSKSNPSDFGLRVYLPEFAEAGENLALSAVWNILDTALGERACLCEITHLEVCALPPNPEQAGFLPLTKLPAYIEWLHRKARGG
jgi:hypothetical protein